MPRPQAQKAVSELELSLIDNADAAASKELGEEEAIRRAKATVSFWEHMFTLGLLLFSVGYAIAFAGVIVLINNHQCTTSDLDDDEECAIASYVNAWGFASGPIGASGPSGQDWDIDLDPRSRRIIDHWGHIYICYAISQTAGLLFMSLSNVDANLFFRRFKCRAWWFAANAISFNIMKETGKTVFGGVQIFNNGPDKINPGDFERYQNQFSALILGGVTPFLTRSKMTNIGASRRGRAL